MAESRDKYEGEIDGFPFTPETSRDWGRDPLEFLLTEIAERRRNGEQPSVEQYVARHPELSERIRELFPMVAAMEHWKTRKEATMLKDRMSQQLEVRRIGKCRVFRELGRGGMGIVYEAFHESLGCRVAVKLLPLRFFGASKFRQRFEREAELAAKLQHTNIVPVLQFGVHEGFCYYVMRYVEGVSLDWIIDRLQASNGIVYAEEIAQLRSGAVTGEPTVTTNANAGTAQPPAGSSRSVRDAEKPGYWPNMATFQHRSLRRSSWRKFARIGLHVANALRYAHRQATVHRDIKPANLLLDKNGRVWITDFGLAEGLERDPHNDEAELSGTLRYMAPEQFSGHFDERSDVYSLGITLYELITLRAAYTAKTRLELVQSITQSSLPRPRQLIPDIPGDLEAIVCMATAGDPDRRYQSAGEIAADLIRFLNGKPVRSRRPGWDFRKFLRQRLFTKRLG